jgi:hypothetical protein
MSNQKGLFVDFTVIRDNGVRAASLTFLRVFQFTLTFNENQGTHVTVGVGVTRLEFSLGVGVWRRWLR